MRVTDTVQSIEQNGKRLEGNRTRRGRGIVPFLVRIVLLCLQFVAYLSTLENISPSYSYQGYEFEQPSQDSLLVCLVIICLVALILRSTISLPSDAVLWILASFLVTPSLVFWSSNPSYSFSSRTTALAAIVIGWTVTALLLKGHRRPLKSTGSVITKTQFIVLVGSLQVLVILVMIYGYGFDGFDLGLGDVYTRRLELREIEGPFPGADYLYEWGIYVLAPLGIAIGFVWKNIYLPLLSITTILIAFSLGGEKAALYSLVLVVCIVCCFYPKFRNASFPWFGSVLTVFLIVPAAVGRLFPETYLDYLVTRRSGLTPAHLSVAYVEYTDQYGNTYFTQHLFKFLLPTQDRSSIGRRVGEQLSPDTGLNANTNIWADAYVSWSFAGVLLTSFALFLLLLVVDRIALSRNRIIASTIFVATCFSMVNLYLPSVLLNGGLLFAVFLAWILPRNERSP